MEVPLPVVRWSLCYPLLSDMVKCVCDCGCEANANMKSAYASSVACCQFTEKLVVDRHNEFWQQKRIEEMAKDGVYLKS